MSCILRSLIALFAITFLVAPGVYAGGEAPSAAGSGATLTPARQVARYVADLNAHQYHAAWLLEAPCGKGFTFSNGPGAPQGSEGWPGRGKDPGMNVTYWPLTSARVTRIARLHIPILERHGILAFGVSGWYTFDYSRVPGANMKHRNGFHMVKIATWKCNGRWGVEGSVWLIGSGGELNWT